MYKTIVASQVRKAYRQISAGEFDEVLKSFAGDVRFQMMGDHRLGGERRGIDEARAWFEEVGRLFPGLRLEAEDVIVSGFPWNTRIATRFRVSASLADGGRYENRGMQFLRLRWGKAVEDRLYEDTRVLTDAIERQRAAATEPVV
ncbi:MAG: nuclear transport factor 2 family protein [Actinomycetota bacterium]|nr:nuclear transport factor 2 family protein [Actinomycetota bacterium]